MSQNKFYDTLKNENVLQNYVHLNKLHSKDFKNGFKTLVSVINNPSFEVFSTMIDEQTG